MKRKGKRIVTPKSKELNSGLLSGALYNKLTRVRFRIGGKKYEVDVGEELLMNKEDIHNQVERIPAVMGYFGSVVILLKEEYENKKALQRRIEAQIDKSVRDSGFTGEARIDKKIKRSDRWIDVCRAVNKAEANYEKAKNLYFSLKNKHEALNSRSADIRAVPSDSILGVTKDRVIKLVKRK